MEKNDVIIVDRLLPWYINLPQRSLEGITVVVLHATEIPQLDAAWILRCRASMKEVTPVCEHVMDAVAGAASSLLIGSLIMHADTINNQSGLS